MSDYETPEVEAIGSIEDVTAGRNFSSFPGEGNGLGNGEEKGRGSGNGDWW